MKTISVAVQGPPAGGALTHLGGGVLQLPGSNEASPASGPGEDAVVGAGDDDAESADQQHPMWDAFGGFFRFSGTGEPEERELITPEQSYRDLARMGEETSEDEDVEEGLEGAAPGRGEEQHEEVEPGTTPTRRGGAKRFSAGGSFSLNDEEVIHRNKQELRNARFQAEIAFDAASNASSHEELHQKNDDHLINAADRVAKEDFSLYQGARRAAVVSKVDTLAGSLSGGSPLFPSDSGGTTTLSTRDDPLDHAGGGRTRTSSATGTTPGKVSLHPTIFDELEVADHGLGGLGNNERQPPVMPAALHPASAAVVQAFDPPAVLEGTILAAQLQHQTPDDHFEVHGKSLRPTHRKTELSLLALFFLKYFNVRFLQTALSDVKSEKLPHAWLLLLVLRCASSAGVESGVTPGGQSVQLGEEERYRDVAIQHFVAALFALDEENPELGTTSVSADGTTSSMGTKHKLSSRSGDEEGPLPSAGGPLRGDHDLHDGRAEMQNDPRTARLGPLQQLSSSGLPNFLSRSRLRRDARKALLFLKSMRQRKQKQAQYLLQHLFCSFDFLLRFAVAFSTSAPRPRDEGPGPRVSLARFQHDLPTLLVQHYSLVCRSPEDLLASPLSDFFLQQAAARGTSTAHQGTSTTFAGQDFPRRLTMFWQAALGTTGRRSFVRPLCDGLLGVGGEPMVMLSENQWSSRGQTVVQTNESSSMTFLPNKRLAGRPSSDGRSSSTGLSEVTTTSRAAYEQSSSCAVVGGYAQADQERDAEEDLAHSTEQERPLHSLGSLGFHCTERVLTVEFALLKIWHVLTSKNEEARTSSIAEAIVWVNQLPTGCVRSALAYLAFHYIYLGQIKKWVRRAAGEPARGGTGRASSASI